MYPPSLRLRQTREALGLTYRDVEQSSYEIAAKRGRPDFIVHLSRLADIENRNVVPSLYKLYSLATIYHMSPVEISSWYEAPFVKTFEDGAAFRAPYTHLYQFRKKLLASGGHGLSADSQCTGLLREAPAGDPCFPGIKETAPERYRYGYIGLTDRRMAPILRPGSMVLVDTAMRAVEDAD